MIRRASGVLVAMWLVAGCKETNPLFCQNPDNANDPACANDAGRPCEDDNDCAAPQPYCDVPDEVCVQCLEDIHCGALTPVCGDDNACHPCELDTECASQVCLNDGSCAASEEVLFASPTGSDVAGCGLTPGDACSLSRALLEATETRNLIKLKQGTYPIAGGEGLVVDGNNADVTLLADGAVIDRNADDGAVITMKNGAGLTVIEGTISDGSGVSGNGITCSNNGKLSLDAVLVTSNDGAGVGSNGCAVSVLNSKLTSNLGGGVIVQNGTFAIVGNFFHLNGQSVGIVGAISIATSANPANRLELNSIHRNQVMDGFGSGIDCNAGTFTARNNIVYGNGGAGSDIEVDGTCKHAFSIVGPMPIDPALDGGSNKNENPGFLDEITGDLHIGSASPAHDAGDPGTDLSGIAARDLDGDPRESPPDIGADHVP